MPIHDWTRVISGTFHDFHHEWITTIKRSLNAGLLPSGYYAMAEQIAGGLGPDVLTLGDHSESTTGDSEQDNDRFSNGAGGLAVASPKTRFTAKSEMELYAQRRSRVVIRHRSGDDVVAIIEIVSPGNKSSRNGLNSFVNKTIEILKSEIHMLIIDLFPPGPRDPNGIHGAIWGEIEEDQPFRLPPDEPLTLVSYSANLELEAFIEPVAVGKPLPDMPLFLQRHGHLLVPLEQTYQAAFEGVPQRWRREL